MLALEADNFEQWRAQARSLLAANVAPHRVHWTGSQSELFAGEQERELDATPATDVCIRLPKAFVELAETVALNRDATRWDQLYRFAYRLHMEGSQLMAVKSDADLRQLQTLAKAVSRDQHKMKAFLRFQRITCNGRERFVSWYEPAHLITESLSGFFVRRFTGMECTILTPDACLHWDKQTLRVGEGGNRPPSQTDGFEAFWLTYYQSIFNPARLKIRAMQKEMPKKYWRNMPEAQTIKHLIGASDGRVQHMLNQQPTDPNHLRNKSKALRQSQDKLRN